MDLIAADKELEKNFKVIKNVFEEAKSFKEDLLHEKNRYENSLRKVKEEWDKYKLDYKTRVLQGKADLEKSKKEYNDILKSAEEMIKEGEAVQKDMSKQLELFDGLADYVGEQIKKVENKVNVLTERFDNFLKEGNKELG